MTGGKKGGSRESEEAEQEEKMSKHAVYKLPCIDIVDVMRGEGYKQQAVSCCQASER